MGEAALSKEEEQAIVDFVVEMVRSSERETSPDRARWAISNNLFRGKQDWGAERESQPWMTKAFIHEFSVLCRGAASALQDMVFDRPDFFRLSSRDNTDPGSTELVKILDKIVRYYVEQIDFEATSYEYFLMGCIFGVAIWKLTAEAKLEFLPEAIIEKIDGQEQKQKKRAKSPSITIPDSEDEILKLLDEAASSIFGAKSGRPTVKPQKQYSLSLRSELINPFNWGYEPNTTSLRESPFQYDKSYIKFYQLEPLFESGMLDKKKRAQLKKMGNFTQGGDSSVMGSYEQQSLNLREHMTEHSKYAPVCEIIDYWGPLLGADGSLIEENCHIIVGNKKVLLKKATNPYFDQRPPYITSVFSKVPMKAVGQGVADGAADQQLLINHLTSLFVDMITLSIYGARVVNIDKLQDITQLEGGIRPGMLIHGQTGGDAKEIFSTVPDNLNQVGPHFFQIAEYLKLSGSKASNVDAGSSNPASRARISATEINANQSRGGTGLRSLGRSIDSELIEPMIRLIISRVLQFGFDNDQLDQFRVRGVITETEFNLLKGIPKVERFREINRNFKVEIKGFRERLERDDFLNRANELVKSLTEVPPGAVTPDWKAIMKRITEALGMDPDEVWPQNTPMDKAREENNLLNNDQMVSLGAADVHEAELPVHYEQLMRNPTQAALNHVMGHIVSLQQAGGQVPPPPKEVAQLLGVPAQEDGGGGGYLQ